MIFLRHFNRKRITCILDSVNVTIMCYTNNNTAYKTQPNGPHFTAANKTMYTNYKMTSHFLTRVPGKLITYNFTTLRWSFLLALAVISAVHHGSQTFSSRIPYDLIVRCQLCSICRLLCAFTRSQITVQC